MKKEESRFSTQNLFEGMVSIRALLNAYDSKISNRKIEEVFVDNEKLKKRTKELSYIKARSYDVGYKITYLDKDEIENMTIGSSHGGLVARTNDRIIPGLCELSPIDKGFYVMLDGIEDPYNFGYALRSLYGAGVDGIILQKRNWMSATGVVCRSSAGASELFSVYTTDNSLSAIEFFKKHNYTTVCADITSTSISAYESELKFPLFLIVGGEKRGIYAKAKEKADKIVHLDYNRDFNMALSAASAASILSFEIMRQNKST